MKLRISNEDIKNELRCENCGVELTEDNIYVREINGNKHYFCCSHCADLYKGE